MFFVVFLALFAPSIGIQFGDKLTPTIPTHYYTYEQMTEFMNKIARNYSDFVSLYTIGQSVEKRELWVLRIKAPGMPVIGVPQVKLVGNIHGNEPVGCQLILHLAEYLLKNYHRDDEIRWIMDRTIIHLLPSMNPDGFSRAKEGNCMGGLGRTNKNNVDLNRSFPDHFKENTIKPEVETIAIQNWMAQVPFVLSISFHGGALVANYPYDSKPEDEWQHLLSSRESLSPDDDVFKYLAMTYSGNHLTMHQGKPCGDNQQSFPGGITNGAAWYVLYGGMQDYNYVAHGCMELTLEVSCCKYPEAIHLPRLWNENKKALLEFMKQAQLGVRGLVLDRKTSAAIPDAILYVAGRHIPFTSTKNGEFWRVLLPGHYILTVAAKGYYSQSFPFTVERTNSTYPTSTWLNIYLQPLNELISEASSKPVDTETNSANLLSSRLTFLFPSFLLITIHLIKII